MKVALGQCNSTIGDFEGNVRRLAEMYETAQARGAELVVFPELAIPGYPPKDLVERPAFVQANLAALAALAGRISGPPAIVGFIGERQPPGAVGRKIHNSAALLQGGQVRSVHHKTLLPTYDVFDEHRHFEPAAAVVPARAAGHAIGLTICEDAWNDPAFWPQRLYTTDPVATVVAAGAEVIVNISASPFTLEKRHLRPRMLAAHARKNARPLVFVNQVGGQDDLVFDGHSLAFDARGELIARGKEFEEDLVMVDLERGTGNVAPLAPNDPAAAYAALVLGTRDYARKCGFRSAVIGLSGGIDSSLVAAVAAAALGPVNVVGVSMPSRYSSDGSRDDAEALARGLGIRFLTIGIEPMFQAFLQTLAPAFAPRPEGTTEENLQARVRGSILMALSNKHGHLVLSTGNKSEIAMGYCTLYGDMAGGLAVISDLPKTMVYAVAREVNRGAGRAVIPETVFTKAPSAELRENQTDQDSLPPYELLDRVLEAHIERELGRAELCAAGFPDAVVDQVVRSVRMNEYKRRQLPPGIKITSKAFGPGRRMPIAQRWPG
jgi:NAD+ synthase (glutamine-hydrolysing)